MICPLHVTPTLLNERTGRKRGKERERARERESERARERESERARERESESEKESVIAMASPVDSHPEDADATKLQVPLFHSARLQLGSAFVKVVSVLGFSNDWV